jgi:ribosomal-protein-alanine N-acetyltransferase
MSPAAAEAILGGRRPPDVVVADGYPTEFSAGVAGQVGQGGQGSPLGPYFVHRSADDVVVGEIGGALIDTETVEIGYAIVESCWGRGYATDAVRDLVVKARETGAIGRIVAHHPLDRPASGRVLAKAGFTLLGETSDTHDGVPIRVQEWHLLL